MQMPAITSVPNIANYHRLPRLGVGSFTSIPTPKSGSVQKNYDDYMRLVSENGLTVLQGNTITNKVLTNWKRWLPLTVEAGKISQADADHVLCGLIDGFDLDVDHKLLQGSRFHANYKSALDQAPLISDALRKRVLSGKTLKLGAWNKGDALPSGDGCVVPQGGVPKKLEPNVIRPVSDHTKSGLNAAVDMSRVQHTVNTYNEIAEELKPGYFMRVEDVDGAFPVLPLHPSVWKYMYVHWFDVDTPLSEQSAPNTLYMHVFGDFGAAPLPGLWEKFFRCVKAIAEVLGIVKDPVLTYVDDNSFIGAKQYAVDAEAERMAKFLPSLGVEFKDLKSRPAAIRQLVLGFWWDSIERTRTLESKKLQLYLAHLREARDASHITLRDMQVLAGRMQRAAMTMPPRAIVYISNILLLMHGLKYPWHRRRVSAALRRDLNMLISVLECNSGRGYFAYDQFSRAPDLYTDAAKERRHTGGGYFSTCGAFGYWKFGASTSRQPIDYLEGFAVLQAAEDIGHTWKNKIVPVWIDNSAFERSLYKGRSKAPRLNILLRKLFLLSVKFSCVFEPHWLASKDNGAADALSRGDHGRFLEEVRDHDKYFGGSLHCCRTSLS